MLRRGHNETKAIAGRQLPDAADEIALIRQVAGGDMTAFETLFRRYYPRLRRFLERMTRRPHLVDEILNDTMLVVWRKAHTFNLRSKLSTWIIGIALRRSLKALDAGRCDRLRFRCRRKSRGVRSGRTCNARSCAGG